jgi:cytochrome c-type biogenesis protein CcmH
MATNIREQVRELVAAGFDEDQVLSYFEASYGEFVRLAPPLRGVNWLVWLAPALGLVAGLVIVTWVLRGAGARRTETAGAPAIEPADEPAPGVAAVLDPLPDDPALARAVLRVRETAYGWPDGRRPGKA